MVCLPPAAAPAFALQNEAVILEMDSVHDFLGFDPEGYFIEFDAFIDHPANTELRAHGGDIWAKTR